VDKFGAPRLFAGGDVTFELTGPGVLVGDNPFSLTGSGGTGAIWIKASPASSGKIVLKSVHSTLGSRSVIIQVEPSIHPHRI
jgi:beta-galactosidase